MGSSMEAGLPGPIHLGAQDQGVLNKCGLLPPHTQSPVFLLCDRKWMRCPPRGPTAPPHLWPLGPKGQTMCHLHTTLPPHQDVCESRHLRVADPSSIQQPFPRREGEGLEKRRPGQACGVCAKTWLGQAWALGLQLQSWPVQGLLHAPKISNIPPRPPIPAVQGLVHGGKAVPVLGAGMPSFNRLPK